MSPPRVVIYAHSEPYATPAVPCKFDSRETRRDRQPAALTPGITETQPRSDLIARRQRLSQARISPSAQRSLPILSQVSQVAQPRRTSCMRIMTGRGGCGLQMQGRGF